MTTATATAVAIPAVLSTMQTNHAFQPAFSIGELHRGGTQLYPLCQDLARMNVCSHCMLRFMNIKQEKAYQQTKEWLQLYTTHKLGWSIEWCQSGCPLCLDILSSNSIYWSEVIEPALKDPTTGEWKYIIEQFTLNISEPVVAKIRQYAVIQVLKSKYSRLSAGYIELKEAIKWQFSSMIIARTGGTAKFLTTPCDFSFLLTFATDIPNDEYNLIVSTLPRDEQASCIRAPGDFSIPSSNNPQPDFKRDGASQFKKRGKKYPRQDVMGQKTVMEALPKIKSDRWAKMDLFKPIMSPSTITQSNNTPSQTAMDTSSDTTTTSSSSSTADPSRVHVPLNYPLPITALVPFPTLLLTAHREPILISGHYRKFYRFLSQSVWKLGDTKMIGHGEEKNRADAKAQSKQGAAASVSASSNNQDHASDDERDPDDVDQDQDQDDEDGDDDDDDDGVGRRMTDSSVEEEIVRMLLPEFSAREYKFHSSGREDMDVRMLGNGRQFFIEFIEAKTVPKSDGFYPRLQAAINSHSDYVEVLDLHLSNKAEFSLMKQNIAHKRKTYRCVVWTEARLTGPMDERLVKLNEIKEIVLQQKTPIRVLHRRSLLTRPKTIYSARTEYVNSHFFYLDLVTSSGTYVKEFVHGDRGRTVPNVCTLIGAHAEILQLDVIGFDSA